jgi:hypothetical protein
MTGFRSARIVAVTLLGVAPAMLQGATPFPPNATTQHPFAAPLPRTPLAKPLVFNGGFGDYRIGHFHAGFDLGTGRKVGRQLFAPESSWIERVWAPESGMNDQSAHDGRTLQLRAPRDALPALSRVRANADSTVGAESLALSRAFPVRAESSPGRERAAGATSALRDPAQGRSYHHRAGLSGESPELALPSRAADAFSLWRAGGQGPSGLWGGTPYVGARAIVRARSIERNRGHSAMVRGNGAAARVQVRQYSWVRHAGGEYVYDSGRSLKQLLPPGGIRPRVLRAEGRRGRGGLFGDPPPRGGRAICGNGLRRVVLARWDAAA